MASPNTMKCRLLYTSRDTRACGEGATIIEYEVDGTITDVNIITMIGCGCLFCEGETMDNELDILFEVKQGRRWKAIAHWKAEDDDE